MKVNLVVLSLLFSFAAHSQSMILGLSAQGGHNNAGSIFVMEAGATTIAQQFSFPLEGGMNPEGDLTQASNGKIYGLTKSGGDHNYGVLFEYHPGTDAFVDKISFAWTGGSYPTGSLVETPNGKLYALTSQGGVNGAGVLFEYDPASNIYTKKIDFDGTGNGVRPYGSLIVASNGKLYGMTTLGGTNGNGTLFEYDPTGNTLVKKFDFAQTGTGDTPYGQLLEASNGKLYGLTSQGGAFGYGVLFEFDIANTLTKKIDFGTLIGIEPHGSLVEGPNGKLYGMTLAGGANGTGVLFEYNLGTSALTKKIDMSTGSDGKRPNGSLLVASNGKMYGLTTEGGANNDGVLFEYDPVGNSLTKRIDFESETSGSFPGGSLIQATDGGIYGLTLKGGSTKVGVLFRFSSSDNSIVKKHDFIGAVQGRAPQGILTRAADGKMYGATSRGGIYDEGVLFSFDPVGGVFEKKLDLSETLGDGVEGRIDMTLAPNGNLYGIVQYGGTANFGTLFEYAPENNLLTWKADFGGVVDGTYPYGGLLTYSDSKLYGTTITGGTSGFGVLFEYDFIGHNLVKKKEFVSVAEGGYPRGGLFKGLGGKLYGLTGAGANNAGTIYVYNVASNNLVKKTDFETIASGSYPNGLLIDGHNGKLYGTTALGGVNNGGVIFEYDTATNQLVKKHEFFQSANGLIPTTSLLRTTSGKMYGITFYGGSNNRGVLFEYDPVMSTVIKKFDFGGGEAGEPLFGEMVEFCRTPGTPLSISGEGEICSGRNTPVNLSVPVISNASSYTWTVPAGAVITSGATTNSIAVNFVALVPGDYEITVAGNNLCGTGGSTSKSFVVNNSPTPAKPVITVNFSNPEAPVLSVGNSDGYQWYSGGDVIPGATAKTLTVTDEGSYTATVTVNGCTSAMSDPTVIVITRNMTWASKNQGENSLHPNPATDKVILSLQEFAQGEKVLINVFDMLGRKISNTSGTGGEHHTINVFGYPDGKYVVTLQNNLLTRRLQFIKVSY